MSDECGCKHEDCNCSEEEMSVEDMVGSNNLVLNAVIDLLIEKNIISEEDLKNKIDSMVKEETETDDSEKSEDSESDETEKNEE
ncbi:MAG: hypothetical protein ACOC1K_02715 [Nanoarchaeota archaeon]